jgi:hypothetical protein
LLSAVKFGFGCTSAVGPLLASDGDTVGVQLLWGGE